MVNIAKKYFGLSLDDHQKVIVMDGKKYLQEAADKGFLAFFKILLKYTTG